MEIFINFSNYCTLFARLGLSHCFCSIQIGSDNFSQENIPAFPPHRHKKYNIKPSFRAKYYFNLLNLHSYYFYGAFPQ
jgi:hypothetical protein